MKLILQILFLLIPVLADCQNSKKNTAPQSGADSISTPSLNREWAAPDFQQVFTNIISSQNNASGEIITIDKNPKLFAKLTDIKNYWFFNSKYHTLDERFQFTLSIQDLVKTVFVNYYQKSKNINGRLSYDKEIAAFMDLLFGISQNQMELAEEKKKTTPDLTEIQLDGFKKMIHGYTTMESGALITIEKDYTAYSEASICRIARSFKTLHSFMSSRIDQESKTEFDGRIANLIKTHPVQCVRTALQ
jgi:hypothetical protein